MTMNSRNRESRGKSRDNCNAMESRCPTTGVSVTKGTSDSLTLVNSKRERKLGIYPKLSELG